MDGVPQTTFIPRKPVSDVIQTRRGGNTFLLFGILVLVFSALLCGGLFAYEHFYLQPSINSAEASIHAAVQQFDSGRISQMATLSNQLTIAKAVLNQHTTLVPFFNFLANNTVVSVRFVSFSYATIDTVPTITLKGEASDFSSLDAQRNQLLLSGSLLQNPVVSDIAVTKNGNVTFSISGTIPPSALSYENELTNSSAAASAPAVTSATPPLQ